MVIIEKVNFLYRCLCYEVQDVGASSAKSDDRDAHLCHSSGDHGDASAARCCIDVPKYRIRAGGLNRLERPGIDILVE